MAFKFNFSIPGETLNTDDYSLTNDENLGNLSQESEILSIKEISFDEKHWKIAKELSTTSIEIGEIRLSSIKASEAEKKCHDCSSISEAIQSHSDLISGKYEGGLKIWEGSIDLCQYLSNTNTDFTSKKILELGCGAGLPGILAIQKGASVVHLQDFNSDVLELVTIPNVILNTQADQHTSLEHLCKFFAGDWFSFLHYLSTECDKEINRYDCILTSETIYNPKNHKHLYAIMKTVLKQEGVIYLAAKSYYFGLGGGVQQFIDLVTQDNFFDLKTVWSTKEGLERVIMQLRRKQDNS